MIGCLSTNHPFSISRNSNALGLFAWQTEWESWPIRKCSHCHSDPFDYTQNKRREASRFQQGGILRCLKMTRTRVKLSDRLLFCPDCKPHGTTKKIPNFIGGNGKFLLLFSFTRQGADRSGRKRRNFHTNTKLLHPDFQERNGWHVNALAHPLLTTGDIGAVEARFNLWLKDTPRDADESGIA